MYCPSCMSIRVETDRSRSIDGSILRVRHCKRCGLRFRSVEEIPDSVAEDGGLRPRCLECGSTMRILENRRNAGKVLRFWFCDHCYDSGGLSYLKTYEQAISG